MKTIKPLLLVALVGFVCYCILSFVPMPPQFSWFVVVVGIILCIVIVLQMLGLWDKFLNS